MINDRTRREGFANRGDAEAVSKQAFFLDV
jgi:hypothetical protein